MTKTNPFKPGADAGLMGRNTRYRAGAELVRHGHGAISAAADRTIHCVADLHPV